MSANDLLTEATRLIFILLGFATVINYIRLKGKTRRDIALVFGTLAVPFLTPFLLPMNGSQENPVAKVLNWFAIVALPFLLLRLLRYFRPVPFRLMRFSLYATLFAYLLLFLEPFLSKNMFDVIVIGVVIYFAVINGYAMLGFVRGALTSYGVVRQRLRLAALGSGLLGAIFLSLVILVFIPVLINFVTIPVLAAAITSAISFYLGFATPRWLRRTWQLAEFRNFLLRISSKPMSERLNVAASLDELCESAMLAVSGSVTAVARLNESTNQWELRQIIKGSEPMISPLAKEGVIERVWESRQAAALDISENLSSADRQLLATFKADTLLVTPIATVGRIWGLLLIFLKHSPLFIDDDLDLISIFAQQSAIFLENGSLVEELSNYSGQLEKRVHERTLELQKSQEQYRRIVETSQEGIWVSDSENLVLYVNVRMAAMLGYTPEEMIGTSGYTYLDPDNVAISRAGRERRNRGVKEQYELKFRRKDGTELITLVSATPMTDDKGKVLGSLALVADITERKHAENEILKLNTELEQRVADRTAQLSAVNRELEAFSYSVSHDLRAPLRAMNGFSQAVLEDYGDHLDADGKHLLERIQAASQTMGLLIDALLELARVSRADLQYEQIDLSQLAHAIEADLLEQYPERHVQFIVQDGLVVKGDEKLLRVALSNLMNNAWKFSSKNAQPRVEFGTTQHNGRLVYYIQDNGVGFDMSYASKLFGAFQRLHQASEFEGTGIGLATVQRVFHRHDGDIWVDAAVNRGATFYFSLNDTSQPA